MNEEQKPIEPGDVVRLNSGGPAMTVKGIKPFAKGSSKLVGEPSPTDEITCVWFHPVGAVDGVTIFAGSDEENPTSEATFSRVTLKRA